MDMFATAPTTKTEKKTTKKAKPELALGRNLDVLAAADAVAKTMKGVLEAYGTMVKSEMTRRFAQDGSAAGRRPENMKGLGESSLVSASLELRKRDSRRTLTEEEATALETAGVKIEEVETQPERFYFNEALITNPEYRAKISQALSLIDFGGESPILRQEKVTSKIVTDESVEQAFAGKTAEEAEQLTQIVGTLAVKPAFTGSLADATQILASAGVTL